jgi:hypothetical protein
VTAKVAETRKTVAALTPMVKSADDAVAPAKAALDAANANVAKAKATLESLKVAVTPKKQGSFSAFSAILRLF